MFPNWDRLTMLPQRLQAPLSSDLELSPQESRSGHGEPPGGRNVPPTVSGREMATVQRGRAGPGSVRGVKPGNSAGSQTRRLDLRRAAYAFPRDPPRFERAGRSSRVASWAVDDVEGLSAALRGASCHVTFRATIRGLFGLAQVAEPPRLRQPDCPNGISLAP